MALDLDRRAISELVQSMAESDLQGANVEAILARNDELPLPSETLNEDEARKEETSKDLHMLISEMKVPQKIKLALFGNQMARAILIRDNSCRQVPLFVLQNPRITEGEIEEIARNTNVDEQVLRVIANNPKWMKGYAIKTALVSNPRVPLAISLHWIKHLQDKDLKKLAQSKNIPQALATHCRKMIDTKKVAQSKG
ncbi:MAG: hypothetical protein IT292_05000 [Deltaproteobacteria bacterium]|nr:hypothetical protein [Deltaproteobacteria bacterium]